MGSSVIVRLFFHWQFLRVLIIVGCLATCLKVVVDDKRPVIMKILFTDLEQADISYSIINDGWFPVADVDLVDGPEGQITAFLTGSREAVVKGHMDLRVQSSCDRCCTTVELVLAAEFGYVCIVGSEENEKVHQQTECRKEDYNRIYLKEPVIDLGQIFCEQVYLTIPSRILCEELCQGLCRVCGVDLNHDRCDCEDKGNDTPFAVLRQLNNL